MAAEFGNAEFGKFGVDAKVESNLFDRDAEAKLLKAHPELAEGKRQMEAILNGALDEMSEAQVIMDALHRKPVYWVETINGTQYINAPANNEDRKTPERLQLYVNKLEKSTLEIYKKWVESEKRVKELTTQLTAATEKKSKRGKKNDNRVTSKSRKTNES